MMHVQDVRRSDDDTTKDTRKAGEWSVTMMSHSKQ